MNVSVLVGTIERTRRNKTERSEVTNFTVISERRVSMDDGEVRVFKHFQPVVAWGRTSQMASELQDGDTVCVNGFLKSESWERDGKKNWRTIVQAQHVMLISRPQGSTGSAEAGPSQPSQPAEPETEAAAVKEKQSGLFDDDDIPF